MATEFVCSIKEAGGDYSTLSDWETPLQSDLTSADNKVFAHGGIAGSISDGDSVSCSSGSGTVYHATSTQVYLHVDSGTIDAGDTLEGALGSVTVSDAGDGVILAAECDNFNQNAAFVLSGSKWVTSETNCIRIRPATGQERTVGTNKLQVGHAPRIDLAAGTAFDCYVDWVYVSGMDFRAQGSGHGVRWYSQNVHFDDCIIVQSSSNSAFYTLATGSTDASASFRNCIFVSNFYVCFIKGTNDFYNCVSIAGLLADGGYGYAFREYAGGTMSCENCYAAGKDSSLGSGSGYLLTGTHTACAANDDTGTSAELDNIPAADVFRVVANDGTEDFRLRQDVTDNVLLGAGVIGTGTATNDGNYPSDIDGNDRQQISDAVWDIGAWQDSSPRAGSTSASTSLTTSASTSVSTSASTSASSSVSSSASSSLSSSVSSSASSSLSSSLSSSCSTTYTLAPPTDLYSNEGSEGAQTGEINPTDMTDTTPVFSAIVHPKDVAVTDVWVQVSQDPTFSESSLEWSSGWLALNESVGPTASDRTEDVTYGQS